MNFCERIKKAEIPNLILPVTGANTIVIKESKTNQKLIIRFDDSYDAVGFTIEHHDFSNDIKQPQYMKQGCEAAVFFYNRQEGKNFVILCELKMTHSKGALNQIKGGFLASKYLSALAYIETCEQKNLLNLPMLTYRGLIVTNRKVNRMMGNSEKRGDIIYLHGPKSVNLNKII